MKLNPLVWSLAEDEGIAQIDRVNEGFHFMEPIATPVQDFEEKI